MRRHLLSVVFLFALFSSGLLGHLAPSSNGLPMASSVGHSRTVSLSESVECLPRWPKEVLHLAFCPNYMPSYLDSSKVFEVISRIVRKYKRFLSTICYKLEFSLHTETQNTFWSCRTCPRGILPTPNPTIQFVPYWLFPDSVAAWTFIWLDETECEVVLFIIWLNSGFRWHADTTWPNAGSLDLETVLIHELGHGLGLYDTKLPGDNMFYQIAPGYMNREIAWPTLYQLRRRYDVRYQR